MTRALDTSLLIRLITNDDPVQAATAQTLIDEPFSLSATVLLETAWTLRSRYGFTPAMLAGALGMVVDLPNAVDTPLNIGWAIERIGAGADPGDMIHIATATGASRFATFDRGMVTKAGPGTPTPVETIR